jgi:hypothetical protein
VQVYGGHGYIREWGMEQFVRDARIAQIYEGTNGVQAMDLIGRKVPEGNGRLLRRLLALVQADVKAAAGDARLAPMAQQLGDALRKVQESVMATMQAATKNPDEVGAAATDFLRMMGLVTTGWMWLKMARVALEKMPTANARRRSTTPRSRRRASTSPRYCRRWRRSPRRSDRRDAGDGARGGGVLTGGRRRRGGLDGTAGARRVLY